MNKRLASFLLILPLIAGCRNTEGPDPIVSMQVVGRNGFSETISNKDRLGVYQNVDFLTSQPYQKVLRVFKKDPEGKSLSKLTTYHSNGGVWQYLEAIDGRAHGKYLEWHENGTLKVEAHILDGLADFSDMAKKSWIFDQECTVWHEMGTLSAEFTYDKGYLQGMAKHYFPDETLQKTISYNQGVAEGSMTVYDKDGNIIEKIQYKQGKKEGAAVGFWQPEVSQYQEQYRDGLLINAIYFDKEGNTIAEIENGEGKQALFEQDWQSMLISFHNGVPEGEIQSFDVKGNLISSYTIKEGKKTGEEWHYYPPKKEGEISPKLMVTWFDDQIQGMTKTWYQNGILESQKELSGSKKQGLSFAYYKSGELMLMEEYDNDHLLKGAYYKKGEKEPVSTIEEGEGSATLYSKDGHFLKKIPYEKGLPVVD